MPVPRNATFPRDLLLIGTRCGSPKNLARVNLILGSSGVPIRSQWWRWPIGTAFVMIAAAVTGCHSDARVPARSIPYKTLKSWSIPAGGYGKVIVIDPQYRNASD